MSSQQTYLVEGMTCEHCVKAVTSELSELDGVLAVEVDLNAGGTSTVVVASEQALPREAIAAAVDEAGYVLAG